ncbi:MAG: phosphopantothenoylcysteine decarboxylase [Chthoniobacteraceae bacterium]
MNHRVIVTCGPSYEPIDEVRRITNFSTGDLGLALAKALADAGATVTCFRGVMATSPRPARIGKTIGFSTNDDLRAKLEAVADRSGIAAVFHVAALADFRVLQTSDERKISSRDGELTLTLVPATKLIGSLGQLFPNARIVGWKYELDGSPADAIEKGRRQLKENGSDACVVNGAAYGPGFGFLTPEGGHRSITGKAELCAFLVKWLQDGVLENEFDSP